MGPEWTGASEAREGPWGEGIRGLELWAEPSKARAGLKKRAGSVRTRAGGEGLKSRGRLGTGYTRERGDMGGAWCEGAGQCRVGAA